MGPCILPLLSHWILTRAPCSKPRPRLGCADTETEVQRNNVACPRSHNWQVAQPGSEPRSVWSQRPHSLPRTRREDLYSGIAFPVRVWHDPFLFESICVHSPFYSFNKPSWLWLVYGSVDWMWACESEGCWFDSQSGHMPVLLANSPVRGMWKVTTHWCFFPSFSLPSPLSKNK